jgi:chemotaxis signal transduction protein
MLAVVAELRNVIVFSVATARGTPGASRYALELRWVREVVSLGFITSVPTAPPAVSGVFNLHGAILPVLDISGLLGDECGPPARQGDGALVIELEGLVVALRIDQVDHVASLHEDAGAVVDSAGRPLTLLDPAKLYRRASELVTAAGEGPA